MSFAYMPLEKHVEEMERIAAVASEKSLERDSDEVRNLADGFVSESEKYKRERTLFLYSNSFEYNDDRKTLVHLLDIRVDGAFHIMAEVFETITGAGSAYESKALAEAPNVRKQVYSYLFDILNARSALVCATDEESQRTAFEMFDEYKKNLHDAWNRTKSNIEEIRKESLFSRSARDEMERQIDTLKNVVACLDVYDISYIATLGTLYV